MQSAAQPGLLAQSFRLVRERWDVLSSQASQASLEVWAAPAAGHVHPSAAGPRVDEFQGIGEAGHLAFPNCGPLLARKES